MTILLIYYEPDTQVSRKYQSLFLCYLCISSRILFRIGEVFLIDVIIITTDCKSTVKKGENWQ